MSHPLEALYKLQRKDQKLIRVLREIQDIPVRKNDIESQLTGVKKKLNEVEENRKKIEVNISDNENETSLIQEKVIKYKQQQMDAETNEQYRAFVKEIGIAENQIKELEEIQINSMEKLEDVKKIESELKDNLASAEAEIADEINELNDRNNELNERLEEMKVDRREDALKCDQTLLKKYTRILQNKKDVAIVLLTGEFKNCCGGCHMQLPPQVINDAKNINKIVNCNFCGRIVYNTL